MRNVGLIAVGLLAAAVLGDTAAAQVVRRTGHGTGRLDSQIDRILADPSYKVLSRDTLIERNDTLDGPILTLGNRLVIEGTITGDLAIVDANVYVRPTGRVTGSVTNIGGGFYRSEQAYLGGLVDHPLAPYHVEREGESLIIVGDVESKWFKLNLEPPTANRVDGVMPSLGATISLPSMGRNVIELSGWGAYGIEHSGWKEALQGGAELGLRRGLTHVAVGIEETTATNDAWNRSDIMNTLSFLFKGKDYRNYYEAERQYVMVARELIRGGHEAVVSIRGQREDGESLSEGSPWVLFKPDSMRINPFIDDAVISSGILNLRGTWTALTTAAEYDGQVEIARDGVAGGDHSFNAFSVWGKWAMQAIANHTLEFETKVQGPLPGTDILPRQRWGTIGGSGTLYTFDIGEFFGDRLVYVETEYSIPFPPNIRLPYLGSPAIQFLHNVGMAWSSGEDHRFEQNVGVRLQFPFVYARIVTNPRDTGDTEYTVGVSFPKSAYPWQKRSQEAARSR